MALANDLQLPKRRQTTTLSQHSTQLTSFALISNRRSVVRKSDEEIHFSKVLLTL